MIVQTTLNGKHELHLLLIDVQQGIRLEYVYNQREDINLENGYYKQIQSRSP